MSDDKAYQGKKVSRSQLLYQDMSSSGDEMEEGGESEQIDGEMSSYGSQQEENEEDSDAKVEDMGSESDSDLSESQQ